MKLKSKLIYSINKVHFYGTHLPSYLKKIIKAVVPKSAWQRIRQQKLIKFLTVKILGPHRGARVYVKTGIERMEFFKILNERKVEYVLLRWWENLPEIPAGEDMDILVRDEHRDLMNDLVTFQDPGSGMKVDIYTITGAKYGSHKSLPYFQPNLARTLINSRVLFRGAYVPATIPHFASLAYHAIFHKGRNSGVQGFEGESLLVEHDYQAILKDMSLKAGIKVDITATGLFQWLEQERFAPANDTLTKLIEILPELSLLEVPLACDARGGEVLVYVVRKQLLTDGLLNDFTSFLEERYQFDVIDVRIINSAERDVFSEQIRGGKWDKGPFKYSGGLPAALVVAYDYHPVPLSSSEQMKQSRMTDRNNLNAKYIFRESLKSKILIKGDYNGVHSADNEYDAWTYISLAGKDYYNRIFEEVESRRQRYATKWKVKKLLSFTPRSKTELIQYPSGNLAIKKTFKPGRERFFNRELFAYKQLAEELDFIPRLLEEGDGYIIFPYHENVLATLTDKERKLLLLSRKKEIIRVIHDMYVRGYSYINFTPENVIITGKNQFYCTNFEFLYKYEVIPGKIEDSFEVAGLPGNFSGDCPKFYLHKSSFNSVWVPFVGKWEEFNYSSKYRLSTNV